MLYNPSPHHSPQKSYLKMLIEDKVIAITGAARGIGRGIALHLAAKGAKIAILDLEEKAMEETVNELKSAGIKARGYRCNVADEAMVESVFKQIVEDFSGIHGLVNNAGILRDAQLIKVKDGVVIDKMSADNYSLVVDVHMKGAFLCAREAASHMITNKVEEGCIINMSSVANRGNFGQTNYSAAKAGMFAQSNVWAKELGRYNIRSMAIAPGNIDTDMLRSMPKAILDKVTDSVALKRLGTVGHIGHTVAYILENDYLSGDIIRVAGGFTI